MTRRRLAFWLIPQGLAWLLVGISSAEAQLAIQDVVSIAFREAQRLGYRVDDMEMSSVEDRLAWLRWRERAEFLRQHPELATALEGRLYWVIHLVPRLVPGRGVGGGGLFVFVDKQNGSILGVYRES